jgi:hypothetical protein
LHNPISFTGLIAKTTKADTTGAKSTQAKNQPKIAFPGRGPPRICAVFAGIIKLELLEAGGGIQHSKHRCDSFSAKTQTLAKADE